MNIKKGRIITFLMKEKTKSFLAFEFYVLFIVMLMGFDLPLVVETIICIIEMFIILVTYMVYIVNWKEKLFDKNIAKPGKNINIIQEAKKVTKEIIMFIPIWIIHGLINTYIIIGESVNQASIDELFYESPIFSVISIIIAPIIEEILFRFLPYKFIKNKSLYIIVSAVVFSAMHVVSEPNAYYYIWNYMLISLYWGYRYYKTKDIFVTISMHSVTNLVATILILS